MAIDDVHQIIQDTAHRIIIDDLVKDGISPEDAEWLIREVEGMSQEMRDRINA